MKWFSVAVSLPVPPEKEGQKAKTHEFESDVFDTDVTKMGNNFVTNFLVYDPDNNKFIWVSSNFCLLGEVDNS